MITNAGDKMAKAGEKMVDTGVARADQMKIQTAGALEDAARKLREANMAAHGEDIKKILLDVEERLYQLREAAGVEYHKIEEGYNQSVEPVEDIIIDHPIPSVLVATGIGVLIGMLLCRVRD
jgi:ElaB/YqjD/DUF883 family membrane-anchored ribosome-binding protein